MRSDRRGRQRRRCRRIVDGLDLPTPFDAADFIGALARMRGRPIELMPVRSKSDIPCGVLITTDRRMARAAVIQGLTPLAALVAAALAG